MLEGQRKTTENRLYSLLWSFSGTVLSWTHFLFFPHGYGFFGSCSSFGGIAACLSSDGFVGEREDMYHQSTLKWGTGYLSLVLERRTRKLAQGANWDLENEK